MTTSRASTVPILATVLTAAALLLAGCSMGSATGTSPANGGSSSAQPGSSAPAGAAGAAAKEVDVCAAVPLEKLASITGRSGYLKTNGGSTTQYGADVSVCQYFDTDDASTGFQFTLAVFRNGDPDAVLAKRSELLGSLQPVSGYGDKAVGSDGDLEVAYGSDVITATDALYTGSSALTTEQLGKIVQALHEKL